MVHAWGASIELWMHVGSWESTRKAFEWHFKRKLIKCRILLNHSERFDWLNAITRFDRRTGVRLSRFRCTFTPYKKRAKTASYVLKVIRFEISTYRKFSIKRRGVYLFHRDFGAALIRGAALI